MLPLVRQSWNAIQSELCRRSGQAAYDAWLSGLRPVLMERGVVFLEAGTRLQCDRVRRLFRPLLAELLSAEIGTQVAVELQPAPEPSAPDLSEVGPQNPVVDESNKTAWLVLRNLLTSRASLPGNLFLFHGAAGCGKTFLLQWWIHQLPGKPMVFDLQSLTKAFQAVHRDDRVEHLREELCRDRTLVLDEVHRVAGKERLQQFLADVLRQRDAAGSLTLLASRWHPKEVRELQPGLCSILLGGFVTKVDLPGPMGRLRFLRALEGAPSRNGRADAIESLAQSVQGSFPELRAAWAAQRGGRPAKYLELIDPARVYQRVRDRVAQVMGLTAADLAGPRQSRNLSLARKVIAYLCVQEGLSRAEVGRYLNSRSRASVSYMTLSLEQQMADSPEVRAMVEGML
ncbi:MAG: hypothetical protein RL148_3224 [Planctomycetota bacterium]|jgi:chromosomal replication initiator protein